MHVDTFTALYIVSGCPVCHAAVLKYACKTCSTQAQRLHVVAPQCTVYNLDTLLFFVHFTDDRFMAPLH